MLKLSIKYRWVFSFFYIYQSVMLNHHNNFLFLIGFLFERGLFFLILLLLYSFISIHRYMAINSLVVRSFNPNNIGEWRNSEWEIILRLLIIDVKFVNKWLMKIRVNHWFKSKENRLKKAIKKFRTISFHTSGNLELEVLVKYFGALIHGIIPQWPWKLLNYSQ